MQGAVEIRGSFVRANMSEIDALGPERKVAILARVPRDVLEAIEGASLVGWLPVEHDLALTRAVVDVLGREGNRQWSRDAFGRAASGPLLKPLVEGARALFGMTPHAGYRLVPRGWGQIYRNAGRLRSEHPSEKVACIVHDDVPDVLLGAPWYLDGIVAAVEAVAGVFGYHAAGELSLDEAAHAARYTVRW